MNQEYLIFNGLILLGPLVGTFLRPVCFRQYLKPAIAAIVVTAVPFLVWDILVSGRHWWFNENFTLPVRILHLPPGEWLFFFTVPYACLLIWENLVYNFKWRQADGLSSIYKLSVLLPIAGFFTFVFGKEYTGLTLIAMGGALLLDWYLKRMLLTQTRYHLFLAIATVLILLCNGYLTARPVVLYGEIYQLGFRIGTIPVEDFGYGYALLHSSVAIYEKLKRMD